MCVSGGLQQVLPHLADVVVERVHQGVDVHVLRARSRRHTARCPRCGKRSGRILGRYERRVGDAPLGGLPVVIVLLIRRFKCLTA
ncbi:transposase family protein, partial [Streptomyces sp. NPDC007818]|uniref:transposase family protein n=1 Tax=Streptomyces sp. NPDC007818 TaxID=3364780 RepID=UPI0036A117B8